MQCKRWKKKVGLPVVRELFGSMSSEGVRSGILVATSNLTSDALGFARKNGIRVIDGEELLRQIKPLQVEGGTGRGASPEQGAGHHRNRAKAYRHVLAVVRQWLFAQLEEVPMQEINSTGAADILTARGRFLSRKFRCPSVFWQSPRTSRNPCFGRSAFTAFLASARFAVFRGAVFCLAVFLAGMAGELVG